MSPPYRGLDPGGIRIVSNIFPENTPADASAGRVSPCPRCDQLVADLDAARQAVTFVTAASIDAMMWAARHLDDPHTDRHDAAEETAEGLLDRFGRILSALTGQTIDPRGGDR